MNEKDLDIAIEKCERIMEMDTRTMQNPVAENGWIFDKVYDLLKFLRQFEFETGGKDDMISRQAAIDALDKVAEMFPYRIPGKAKTYRQYNEAWSDAIDAAENALEALPPTQSNLSEAYSKAVFTWLMGYQIRTAELKGRYTPYEVLSWVVNDWRKEHERSD